MRDLILLTLLLIPITSHALPKPFYGKTPVPPKGNEIQFIYEPFEGPGYAKCSYTQSPQNPYDKEVTCPNGRYVVHLALSAYTHPSAPKLSYELLYWVDGNGATTWFHLDEPSKVMTVESSQSITDQAAALRLILKIKQ